VESDAWPQTPEAAAALVALVLEAIIESSSKDREQQLSDFMKAAWPSERASRQ
jgi:hypothetical protein